MTLCRPSGWRCWSSSLAPSPPGATPGRRGGRVDEVVGRAVSALDVVKGAVEQVRALPVHESIAAELLPLDAAEVYTPGHAEFRRVWRHLDAGTHVFKRPWPTPGRSPCGGLTGERGLSASLQCLRPPRWLLDPSCCTTDADAVRGWSKWTNETRKLGKSRRKRGLSVGDLGDLITALTVET